MRYSRNTGAAVRRIRTFLLIDALTGLREVVRWTPHGHASHCLVAAVLPDDVSQRMNWQRSYFMYQITITFPGFVPLIFTKEEIGWTHHHF
ncbi:MAG: hypothetical protein ACLR8P_14275 [Clostridium fessum]